MTQEEIRIRSVYLFLACSRGIEQAVDRLMTTFPDSPPSSRPVLDKTLKREVGLLFRYWTTRHIWEQLEANEEDAKQLNLALLRLFTETFRLAKDGSGMRYAELSSPHEEIQELRQRITNALGVAPSLFANELEMEIVPWRDTVIRYTVDAVHSPLELLTVQVKAWAQRTPETT